MLCPCGLLPNDDCLCDEDYRDKAVAGPASGSHPVYPVFVCDSCGSITDAHGEPVGCVNTACDEPAMRETRVAEPWTTVEISEAMEYSAWRIAHGVLRR